MSPQEAELLAGRDHRRHIAIDPPDPLGQDGPVAIDQAGPPPPDPAPEAA